MLTAVAEPAPILDMNTTPLIDVMLVLLVMLIITVPPQRHAVKLDLPTTTKTSPLPDPIKNVVVITRQGALLWNGQTVSKGELRGLLEATATMSPAPELHVQPDAAARYALVDEVLALSRQAGVTSMGFVGNQNYAHAF